MGYVVIHKCVSDAKGCYSVLCVHLWCVLGLHILGHVDYSSLKWLTFMCGLETLEMHTFPHWNLIHLLGLCNKAFLLFFLDLEQILSCNPLL